MSDPKQDRRTTVLVVDDNPDNIQIVAALLQELSVAVAFATDGESAISLCGEQLFSAVLLDVMMPGLDGFETCRRIKCSPEYKDVPVVFLTAKQDKESVVRGFEVGGVDYITKPIFGPELITRLEAQLRYRDQQLQLEEINVRLNHEILKAMEIEGELRKSQEELRETNRSLEELATTDGLTGLLNRRELERYLIDEVGRVERGGASFSVVLADIDFFKRVNDTYGHDCGDVALTTVADILKRETRTVDKVSRWGGEEFLLFLPRTSPTEAVLVADKLRRIVEETPMRCDGGAFSITMTLGVAWFERGSTIDVLLRVVDGALYRGKSDGRNRVVRADEDS